MAGRRPRFIVKPRGIYFHVYDRTEKKTVYVRPTEGRAQLVADQLSAADKQARIEARATRRPDSRSLESSPTTP